MTEGDPMVTSIGYSLGIGSGLDTQLLIQTLSDAARAPKEALIDRREQLNSARISALADASVAIDSFATALSTLISGGTLFIQPSVSDTGILTATARPGARLGRSEEHTSELQSLMSTSYTVL